ncbi:hypothetical protein DEI99_002135 [Curtobacterium sp. MCLR17_036]|uniref:hypothetical protein n=1 Tax=Curtobacterium sp. MCLR17_036 TaxID=2175620 RepID=UPI000DA8AE45|nr:hypothetical protein [Curtobacterium sp. MCLR17_036]WIE65351.1 hypothetical protein DEI99_002135 [Curtobacterium sp. MCLR17_036]
MNTTTTTKTRRTRSLLATAAVAVVLLPGLLAGCSSAEDTDADGPTVGSAQKGASLAECMRGKGYEMADPASNGGTVEFGLPDGADPEQYQSDLKACLGDGEGAGDATAAKPMPGFEEKMQQAAACLRERGFADYPDDQEGQRAYRPEDPTAFDEAARACNEEALGSDVTGVGE